MLCTLCMVKDAVITDRPAPASVVKVLFTRDDMLRATVLAAYSFDTWLYDSADYHPHVITMHREHHYHRLHIMVSRYTYIPPCSIADTRMEGGGRNTTETGSHSSKNATVRVTIQAMTFNLSTGLVYRFTAITEPAFLQLKDVHYTGQNSSH